jgi:phenylalanyl-tRNA synthetase beta chain
VLSVRPPAWRRDLGIAVDLIEEIARIEGYERIDAVEPSVPPHAISSARFELERRVAHALAALGYHEVITYSLQGASLSERMPRASVAASEPAVEVRNPLSEEQRFLRSSLLPGLLDYLESYGPTVRVFEIGDVFAADQNRILEQTSVAFGFAADPSPQPWHDSSFVRLKGDCEALLRKMTGRRADFSRGAGIGFHPGKTASVSVGDREVGKLGCIDPRVSRAFELEGNAYFCMLDLAALPEYETPRYRPPSKYPSTYRDIALVVGVEVSAREIERAVAAALGDICTAVRVFDEYRGPQAGEDRKSLAVRMTLQRYDATITDEEADAAVSRVLDAVRDEFGATIRA